MYIFPSDVLPSRFYMVYSRWLRGGRLLISVIACYSQLIGVSNRKTRAIHCLAVYRCSPFIKGNLPPSVKARHRRQRVIATSLPSPLHTHQNGRRNLGEAVSSFSPAQITISIPYKGRFSPTDPQTIRPAQSSSTTKGQSTDPSSKGCHPSHAVISKLQTRPTRERFSRVEDDFKVVETPEYPFRGETASCGA